MAATCTWFGAFTTEFDMQISPNWAWTTGSPAQFDLFSVTLPEFGHALGLLHTQNSNWPGAVMCKSYNSVTTFKGPKNDDVNGVVSLYGGTPVTATPTATSTPQSRGAAPPRPPSKPEPEAPQLPVLLPAVARD